MGLPKRKPTRLKGYDYSQNGAYFITICTHNRKCLLSNIIVGEGLCALPQNTLTSIGNEIEKSIQYINDNYIGVKIDKYIIMPNHIHIIIILDNTAGASPCPTISDVICSFKSLTTRICNKSKNKPQKNISNIFPRPHNRRRNGAVKFTAPFLSFRVHL